jgi:uncharacterized membrane protein (UPF0182 family)
MTAFEHLPRTRHWSGKPVPRAGRLLAGGILVLVVLLVLALIGSTQLVDYLWFDALGYGSVFVRRFLARAGLFLGGAALTFLVLWLNLLLARRLGGPRVPAYIPREEMVEVSAGPSWVLVVAAGVVALAVGLVLSSAWETVLLALVPQAVGLSDPVFGLDIGFYLFTLPALRLLHGTLTALVLLSVLGVLVAYLIFLAREGRRVALRGAVVAHGSVLAGLFLLLVAAGYWLDRFDVLFSHGRSVYGAAYTDVNVRLPALLIMSGLLALGALVVIGNAWYRRLWPVVVVLGGWLGAAFVLLGLWPALVQRFVVEPSELANERPYLERNIALTRRAFALDRIEERQFTPRDELTAADIARNAQTFTNLRLWDYRPLRDTYNQVQSIRLYYEFPDIDIDRYVINGQLRQVMLGARELVQARLPDRAQTWVTRRLQFTHGYGVAMNTVSEVTPEGLPRFVIRDIPPVGEIPLTQPAIYFGERTDGYVIVGTRPGNLEFDYPSGEDNVFTEFRGNTGIRLDQWWKRLLLAWRLGDGNIVLSQYLYERSQVLLYRLIQDRVSRLAPFLLLDPDPYIVVDQGRLVWMVDGYTISDRFPYSEPFRRGRTSFSYIRNSVKAVVDAYDGSVTFYIADEDDPLIRAWSTLFPGLLRPMAEMPASLQAHRRYPEYIFRVQATMYQTYHMTDPQVFYNREDQWAIPIDLYGPGSLPMEPYYVILRIPGEDREEFVQILPFTPNRRDNMIAWLAARSDGEHYGKLVAIRFPPDRAVFGPAQIGARINQDPTISAQITLWNQQGSKVVRGNLLVIPVEQTLLYLEPLYLQAERSQLPELKRVVLATATRVVMDETLEAALARIVEGGRSPPPPASTPAPSAPAVSSDVAALARAALEYYDRAQSRLRAGDFAGYGEEVRQLEAVLRRLGELTAAR